MVLIKLGKCDKTYIFLIISSVCYFIRDFSFKFTGVNEEKINPLVYFYLMCLGESLVMPMNYILNLKQKDNNQEIQGKYSLLRSDNYINLFKRKKKMTDISTSRLFIYTIPLALCETLFFHLEIIVFKYNYKEASEVSHGAKGPSENIFKGMVEFVKFIMNAGFSVLLFGFTINRHQIFGLSVAIIGFLFILFAFYTSVNYTNFLSLILVTSLYSGWDLYGRFLTNNLRSNPYTVSGINGILNLLFGLIYTFTLKFFKCSIEIINIYCEENEQYFSYSAFFSEISQQISNNKMLLLSYFIFMICSTGIIVFFLFLIYYLGPTYKSLADIFSIVVIIMIQNIGHFGNYMPLIIFGFLLILVGNTFYNEIIILNFWKMYQNAKIDIDKRKTMEDIQDSFFMRKIYYEINSIKKIGDTTNPNDYIELTNANE